MTSPKDKNDFFFILPPGVPKPAPIDSELAKLAESNADMSASFLNRRFSLNAVTMFGERSAQGNLIQPKYSPQELDLIYEIMAASRQTPKKNGLITKDL